MLRSFQNLFLIRYLKKTYFSFTVVEYLSFLAIFVGIILRVTLRSTNSLWEDEVIATTHAVQPVLGLFLNVLVNDIHPPLYFLLLHMWSCVGQSNAWFIAFSEFFSFISLGSFYFVVRSLSGPRSALIATALFSLLPTVVWMSQEVRMYSILTLLLIWMLYFTHRYFTVDIVTKANNKFLCGSIILLGLSIIYSHAIGFISVFFFGVYSAYILVDRKAGLKEWKNFLLIYVFLATASAPVLLLDYIHKADMPPIGHYSDVLFWMGNTIVGEGGKQILALSVSGIAIYLLICSIGIIKTDTRKYALCFVLFPILFCLLAAVTIKPIFKINYFSTLVAPFNALILAIIINNYLGKQIYKNFIYATTLIVFLSLSIINRSLLDEKDIYYQSSTSFISSHLESGDVIWAPQMSVFWGMAWYLVGPNWGSPMAISEPFRPESRWWKIYDILGEEKIEELGLRSEKKEIFTEKGLGIVIGAHSYDIVGKYNRIWIVSYSPRDDFPAELSLNQIGDHRKLKSYIFPPLTITLYTKM